MKTANMGNRVRVGVLLTMFVGAMLMLVMSHATPSLAAGSAAPSFESNSYEFSVDENTAPDTLVQSVAATDLDGDSLTYSVGGTDAAQFNEVFALNTSTGEITVKTGASINYESAEPTSYRVNVMVTDGEDDSGATQSQPTTDATATVVIEIVNVDEPGTVTLSTTSPQLGVGLFATLTDPDGRRGGIYNSWWSRSNNADGPFFLTADDYRVNYRSTAYTPKEADKYMYIKFTVQYFDRTCTRVSTRPEITRRCLKTAGGVSASRVADEDGLIVQQQVSNTPATGQVAVTSGGLQVGYHLNAEARNVRDANGTQSLSSRLTIFHWKWFRIDPVTAVETQVPSWVHGGWYTWVYVIKDADRGKGIQARVSFLDDHGNTETLKSPIFSIPAPPNNVATGSPVITGTAQVGETLSVDLSGVSDADTIVTSTLTYLWYANDGADDTAIDGTTGSTYTLVADDEGKTITVQVIFTDGFSYNEVVTSAPTAAVTGATENTDRGAHTEETVKVESNTPATGLPTITGTAQVGETLTADTTGIADGNGLENAAFAYQWLADDVELSGATSSTYTLADADAGKAIKVRVSFTDDGGNDESLTSAATDTVELPPLTASVHNVPSSHNGQDSFTFELRFSADPKPAFSYTTVRDHAFTVTGGLVTYARRLEPGKNVRWQITVSPGYGAAITIALNATTDCSAQGAICTEEGGKLSGGLQFTVPGPLTPVLGTPNTPATGLPTITGTAQVGGSLTADTTGISDDDGLGNAAFAYQWLADDTEINGANASTYTLADADAGKTIKVQISFTDDADNDEELTSAATGAVAAAPPPPNTPATGSPTITGAAQVGETLTADTTGISDGDGLDDATFAYQWLADNAEINGETASTYTLVASDAGKAIKVRVSFTDDAGNDEELTSAATGAVAAAPPPPNTPATGSPTITGTAQVGETLTADTTGISDGDGLDNATFAYQWLADGAEINGATASTYTLADDDEGKAIKVRVSFTDDDGNDEELTSAATGAVAAAVVTRPLTATVHGVPSSHNGQNAFTFELRFSEAPRPNFSYTTVRDHAFTVTGGSVTYVRRLDRPGNIRWEITVTPSSSADVAIALNATTDCSARGAICTEDGRPLSAPLVLTVNGPSQ